MFSAMRYSGSSDFAVAVCEHFQALPLCIAISRPCYCMLHCYCAPGGLSAMATESVLTFGKHKGKTFAQIAAQDAGCASSQRVLLGQELL